MSFNALPTEMSELVVDSLDPCVVKTVPVPGQLQTQQLGHSPYMSDEALAQAGDDGRQHRLTDSRVQCPTAARVTSSSKACLALRDRPKLTEASLIWNGS